MTGEVTRLAFVGQTTYFAACALTGRVGSIDACFVDYREGASPTTLLERLDAAAPDVVLVFKPEIIPRGLLAELDATTIGYLTEPIPRRRDIEEHPDLRRRLENLRSLDAANFDRVITFDPDLRIPDELGFEPWRAMALPVADRYFGEIRPSAFSRRALFIGRSTAHRERVLTPAKHRFDLLHIAHGVGPDELERLLGETDVGINVHNEDYPNFENRVLLHLAAGNLLVSEPLQPSYGLEAGLDYVELEGPAHLLSLLEKLATAPDLFRRIRLRGRAKAELHRASRVYPALLHDLRLDLGAFGSRRKTARPSEGRRRSAPAVATRSTASHPPRVAIVGTFDVGNFGDLLFPLIAQHELEARVPGVEVVAYSYHAREAGTWAYEVRPLSQLGDELGEIDLVLVGGGHLIRFDKSVAFGYGPPDAALHHPTAYGLMPTLLAGWTGVPVAWNAVGVSPATPGWAEPLLAEAARAVAYLGVRDEPSAAELRRVAPDVGVAVVPDTAFGLAALDPGSSAEALALREELGLNGRYVVVQPSPDLAPFSPWVAEALRRYADQGLGVVELPISPDLGDAVGVVDVRMPTLSPARWPSPLAVAGLVAGAEAVIARSLHLSIAALTAGVPVVRRTSEPGSKYRLIEELRGVEVVTEDVDGRPLPLGRKPVGEDVCALVKALDGHWDAIAALVGRRSEPRRRATAAAIGRLTELEETAGTHTTTKPLLPSSPGGPTPDDPVTRVPLLEHVAALPASPVRKVAFYLPQFHPIPENDAWWGRGFTEWTNVTKARPLFEGHHQPHRPGELGYYDLRVVETQRRQVELAKLYGVDAFCFHFYWFGGRRLLERPLEQYLADPSLELPFCLCWANESWSRRWDGREDDILIEQTHSEEDDVAFVDYVRRYLVDPRYVRVDGRPLLVVYRPGLLPDARATVARWRDRHREKTGEELFVAHTMAFDDEPPEAYGCDASIEFPPVRLGANARAVAPRLEGITPLSEAGAHVFDGRFFVTESERYRPPDRRLFRGVCPGWDNTPRRGADAYVLWEMSPARFQTWLRNALVETEERLPGDERLVFVNAWNEWGEGCYLEPDERQGYAYLEAVRVAAVRAAARPRGEAGARVVRAAAVVHAPDVVALAALLERFATPDPPLELVVTTVAELREAVDELLDARGRPAQVLTVEGGGAVAFLDALGASETAAYDVLLRLPGAADDGGVLGELLDADAVTEILDAFAREPQLGLVAAASDRARFEELGEGCELVRSIGHRLGIVVETQKDTCFPSGAVFVRPAALAPLRAIELPAQEPGEDGPLAAAVTRSFGLSTLAAGFRAEDTRTFGRNRAGTAAEAS